MTQSAINAATTPPISRLRRARQMAAIVLVRVRFFIAIGVLLLAIGYWPALQNRWDKWTRLPQKSDSISGSIEYWCPMCPGVVSDWPSKCPVCSMTLIRRDKGEMTPLPDGVVARVQLSPYRIQLAGVRTASAEYRKLDYEIAAAGLTESSSSALVGSAPAIFIQSELSARDAALLSIGQNALVHWEGSPGEPLVGQLLELKPLAPPRHGSLARLLIDDQRQRLRAGEYVKAIFRTPLAPSEAEQRLALSRWRDRTAFACTTDGRTAALVEAGIDLALRQRGWGLVVPEGAVVDSGSRQVVFVEGMQGEFDAVAVSLGRRCGDFYPVHAGLESGQRVVASGAILLDAQTRLNPSAAAAYFGAGSKPAAATPPPPPASNELSPEDRLLVERQKICPVTSEPLDSMGGPVAVIVNGRKIFVCCKGCESPLRRAPAKYLSSLPR